MRTKKGGGSRQQADDLKFLCLEALENISQDELLNILEKLRIGSEAADTLLFGWKRMNDETVAYFLSVLRLTLLSLQTELEKVLPHNEVDDE